MSTSDANKRRCSYCGEEISTYSRRCQYCGSLLEPVVDVNMYNPPPKALGTNALSNGMKVFITAICSIIPGIGQLAGIIISIVFLNAEEDEDRKSFGAALLIASLIVFFVTCVFYFLIGLAFSTLSSH